MAVKRSANGLALNTPPLALRGRGGVLWTALTAELGGHVEREWFGSGPHRLAIAYPRPEGLAARPATRAPPTPPTA